MASRFPLETLEHRAQLRRILLNETTNAEQWKKNCTCDLCFNGTGYDTEKCNENVYVHFWSKISERVFVWKLKETQ